VFLALSPASSVVVLFVTRGFALQQCQLCTSVRQTLHFIGRFSEGMVSDKLFCESAEKYHHKKF
jgi:hypothetical protein